jgi:hypothetical protein
MGESAIVRARRAIGFDPRFHERDPLLSLLAGAARLLDAGDDFPPVATIDARLGDAAGVAFVPAERGMPYDATIALEGRVPTRPRSWHDLLNALVWATFPRAKRAFHARQHRALDAAPHRRARTRELDALALFDEGGVILVAGCGASRAAIFGHAIYETLVLGGEDPTGAAIVLEAAPGDEDAALAAALSDPRRLTTPGDLLRVPIAGLRVTASGA